MTLSHLGHRWTKRASPTTSGALPTVGVEEEFFLLDPRSAAPVPIAAQVLSAARGEEAGDEDTTFQAEVLRCQVETASPICHDLAELEEHLRCSRARLSAAARRHGAVLAAVGAAPWGEPDPQITPTDRYLAMRKAAPALLSEQLICGMHVHVEVPSRAVGVDVINRLRPQLHVLLALSANSPFWRGAESGFASWRAVQWQRWPVEGPPPFFTGAEDYERRVQTLLDTRVIMDRAMLYWHVRLSDQYPTVEVRVADVAVDAATASAHAGLVRAMVMKAMRDRAAGMAAPRTPYEVLRAASWQAARDGLGGALVDLAGSPWKAPELRPAREVVLGVASQACTAVPEAEAETVLAGVHAVLERGDGAQRQRRAVASGGVAALLALWDDGEA
ncbi:carboxylate-amine ligase [Pedococcus sp. 5OH_020]|uniref:carboxylate-amine ligase n=1 Tax=Pedococcus sp. 5OH_020 TaxID=2989814 RepID=UPI0022E99745|nr:glutamate--cysteine ligase [Pedococcus sp. 5OH_020]